MREIHANLFHALLGVHMAEAAAAAAPDKLQIEAAALLDLYDTLISVFAAVVLSGIVNNSLQAINFEGWILALPLIHLSVAAALLSFAHAISSRRGHGGNSSSSSFPIFLLKMVGHTAGWQALSFLKAAVCAVATAAGTPIFDDLGYRVLLVVVVFAISASLQWLLLAVRKSGTPYAELAAELDIDALRVGLGWALVAAFNGVGKDTCATTFDEGNSTSAHGDAPCVPSGVANATDSATDAFDFAAYYHQATSTLLLTLGMTVAAIRYHHWPLRMRCLLSQLRRLAGGAHQASAMAHADELARTDAAPLPHFHTLWVAGLQLMVAWSVLALCDAILSIELLSRAFPYGGPLLSATLLTLLGHVGARHFANARAADSADVWPTLDRCCEAVVLREGGQVWPPPCSVATDTADADDADATDAAGAPPRSGLPPAWDRRHEPSTHEGHATKLLKAAVGGSTLLLRGASPLDPFPTIAFVPPWVTPKHDDSQWATARVRAAKLARCSDGWTTDAVATRHFRHELFAAVMGLVIGKSWEQTLNEGILQPAFEAWDQAEEEDEAHGSGVHGADMGRGGRLAVKNAVLLAVLFVLRLAYGLAHRDPHRSAGRRRSCLYCRLYCCCSGAGPSDKVPLAKPDETLPSEGDVELHAGAAGPGSDA